MKKISDWILCVVIAAACLGCYMIEADDPQERNPQQVPPPAARLDPCRGERHFVGKAQCATCHPAPF